MMTEDLQVETISAGHNDLATLFEQAASIPEPIEWTDEFVGVGTQALRDDYQPHIVDLEQFFPGPRRAKTDITLQDTRSLIDYARRFDFDGPTGESTSNPTEPIVYINRRNGPIAELIIDEHSETGPGWRQHRAKLVWQYTPEWLRCKKNDRKMISQVEFAELIEDGLDDILEPDGGDLLEIAQTIKGTMTANIKSGRYLSDGTIKAIWDEDLEVTGGREQDLVIPGHFVLLVRVLEEGTPIKIKARLRFSFKDRRLSLGYFLERPTEVEYAAINAEVQLIKAGVSPTTLVVLGHPG